MPGGLLTRRRNGNLLHARPFVISSSYSYMNYSFYFELLTSQFFFLLIVDILSFSPKFSGWRVYPPDIQETVQDSFPCLSGFITSPASPSQSTHIWRSVYTYWLCVHNNTCTCISNVSC